jgi:hypothetical protein
VRPFKQRTRDSVFDGGNSENSPSLDRSRRELELAAVEEDCAGRGENDSGESERHGREGVEIEYGWNNRFDRFGL